jgi:hypothetical protein
MVYEQESDCNWLTMLSQRELNGRATRRISLALQIGLGVVAAQQNAGQTNFGLQQLARRLACAFYFGTATVTAGHSRPPVYVLQLWRRCSGCWSSGDGSFRKLHHIAAHLVLKSESQHRADEP